MVSPRLVEVAINKTYINLGYILKQTFFFFFLRVIKKKIKVGLEDSKVNSFVRKGIDIGRTFKCLGT